MTTSELVTRLAAFFGRLPHEIWALPLHYYLAIRREYLKIVGPPSEKKSSMARTGGHPNFTVETISASG